MIKQYFQNFINKFTKKNDSNNKKNIENLVVFLILLIITIIAVNTIWGEKEIKTEPKIETNSSYKQLADNIDINSNNPQNNEYNLEESLENILCKMSGVRKSTSLNYIFRN